MIRFTIQLVGVTVFALALMWFVGSGEAVQNNVTAQPVLWADTTYINTEQAPNEQDIARQKREDFLRSVKRLPETAFNIRNHYMDEIDPDALVKAGIDGMLSELDRFSVLLEKDSYDALMESTHGKYEGLGMQIDQRDDRIIIITPIEGSPAYKRGLRAGDVIMAIDGKDTEGMTTSQGADLMRGPAGTTVKLMIKRTGVAELMEFELERAVIELKSVPYAGVIPGTKIGYVRVSRFAEETSQELRDALDTLNNDSITGLVFDLRSNGGGLLDQAKETAELFLQAGREIVYTRGRYEGSEQHYYSERQPLYPDKPLIILVNEGTASASEIVSGAVQDWDRGLILGAPTYGKGLVQRIFPISSDGELNLKLTTARYYVPSGRCIQKPERQVKAGSHAAEELEAEQETTAAESLSVSERGIFYTNGGRVVYGGGGIVPDIEVESRVYQPIEINLERQALFFDFAVDYLSKHPDTKPDVEITKEIVDEFRHFLTEKHFTYKTTLQVEVEDIDKTIGKIDDSSLFRPTVDSLKALVETEKADDIDQSLDYIKTAIKREIAVAIAGQKGLYEEVILRSDDDIRKAVDILQTPKEYSQLISKGMDAKKKIN